MPPVTFGKQIIEVGNLLNFIRNGIKVETRPNHFSANNIRLHLHAIASDLGRILFTVVKRALERPILASEGSRENVAYFLPGGNPFSTPALLDVIGQRLGHEFAVTNEAIQIDVITKTIMKPLAISVDRGLSPIVNGPQRPTRYEEELLPIRTHAF